MNYTIFVILTILLPSTLSGQINKLSLQDCLDLAKKNNIAVLNQSYAIEKLNSDQKIAKGNFLPNVSLNLSQNYNLGDSFNVSTNLGQRESSSNLFSISSSVVLYEGKSATNKLKYSKLNTEKGTVELERIKRELELSVTNDYLQALLFKESITATESQLKVSRQQLARNQILYTNGEITEKEVLENKSLVETDRKNRIIAINNYKNSILKISERIFLQPKENINIKRIDLSEIESRFEIHLDDRFYNEAENHPFVTVSEFDIKLQEQQLKINKAAFLPRLTFNYEYGTGYYHILGEEDVVFNSSTNQLEDNGFFEQLNNNKSHRLHFSLTVPLFNRFSTKANYTKSKSDYEISKKNFIENKKLFLNRLKVAHNDMLTSKSLYKSAQKNFQFQQEAFRASNEQYKAGLITIYNFIDSKNRLLNAQTDFIKSKYEYLLKVKILELFTK